MVVASFPGGLHKCANNPRKVFKTQIPGIRRLCVFLTNPCSSAHVQLSQSSRPAVHPRNWHRSGGPCLVGTPRFLAWVKRLEMARLRMSLLTPLPCHLTVFNFIWNVLNLFNNSLKYITTTLSVFFQAHLHIRSQLLTQQGEEENLPPYLPFPVHSRFPLAFLC